MRVALWVASLLVFGCTAAAARDRPLVAVIDSGIAETAELHGLLLGERDMASPMPRPAFRPRYDHGTMVATILARAAGRQVAIMSFRIDDPAGCPPGAAPPCQPDAAPIVAAIRAAAALSPDAINISLALADDPRIAEAVREATEAGVTVVMAAGNNGFDHPSNRRMALAGGARAVLVGAVDAAGRPWAFSNRPEQGAPGYAYVWRLGVDVPTERADGAAVTGTGTSFATPIETAQRLRATTAGGARGAGVVAALR